MTENQIAELANIGRQYIYLDEADKCRLSHGGVLEILKRYEELRAPDIAGLRVKLRLAGVNSNSFIIPDFYFVPREGDLIDVENLIDEKNYSDEELHKIYSLLWSVWYVKWGKDEFGFFAEIGCEGG
jgi:choline kinase